MSGYPEMGEWLSRIYSLRVADTNGYPLVDSLVGLLVVRSLGLLVVLLNAE